MNVQLLINVFHFSSFPGSFWVIAGAVLLIIIITGIISIVHCLRTTRGASRALNLPIPSLPEDRTPLNSEPDNPVPVSIDTKIQNLKEATLESLFIKCNGRLMTNNQKKLVKIRENNNK